MPIKCKVSVDEAVAVVKDYMEHFRTDKLPAWSSDIWKDMSKALGERWNSQCVYTNVRNNRRSILSRARNEMGVIVPTNTDYNSNKESIKNNDTECESDSDTSILSCNSTKTDKSDTFNLILSVDDSNDIKPKDTDDSNHNKTELKPKVRSYVIPDGLWLQFRHPGAFVFERAEIKQSQDELSYLIKVVGACKSRKRKSTFMEEPQSSISSNLTANEAVSDSGFRKQVRMTY